MINIYRKQLAAGRHFLHEHPEPARNWKEEDMVQLLADERVDVVVSDQCEYGLVTPNHQGNPTPAKKPTSWASSFPRMLQRLSRRCPKTHRHQNLLAVRAKDATLHHLPIIVEILRGMMDEPDRRQHVYDEYGVALNMVPALHSTLPTPPDTHH